MASSDRKLLIVSADGHAGARMADYLPYFSATERAEVEGLLDEEARIYRQMQAPDFSSGPRAETSEREHLWSPGARERRGGWDPALRLAQLDREGVAAEILIPGHQLASLPLFSVMNRPFDAPLRAAGARAYHRWLADFMAAGDGRLFGMADPGPCLDIDEAVSELRWAAGHGFVGVGVPGIIEDQVLPSLFSDHFEPFWQACVELDMALVVHAGWGFPQGRYQEFISRFVATHLGEEEATAILAAQGRLDEEALAALQREFAESPASPLRLDFGPRRLLWRLMLAGVFDRYPTLRLVLTEVRSDWIPATLAVLDFWFDTHETPLRRRPSEYWASNCYATPSSIHLVEVRERAGVGVDRLMLGLDYPHPEGIWPDTADWLRIAFAGVPEDEARRILGENAIGAYGLDRAALAAVAERVGPSVRDVLGGGEVPPAHVEHFHRRSGFLRPTERVDSAALLELLDEDLRAAVG